MPSTIIARDVHKSFGKVRAIRGMSFQVGEGQIVGLVGPNGCGKTTMMRMLIGRLAADGGHIKVAGADPSKVATRHGPQVGYMPQRGGIYPDLTVAQNLRFWAAVQGVGRRERRKRIDEVLAQVQLSERQDSRVRELSGGMARRASLACAMVHRPPLFFLDEPTVGIDPEIRHEMWQGLRRLRDEGVTILVSTHYIGEAENCDQVLLMRRGKELAMDPPAALRKRTATDDLESAFIALLEESR